MSTSLPVPEMKQLWKLIFHDTDSYITRIYDNWVDEKYTLFIKDDRGALQSMLNAHLFHFTGGFQGLYLHGLATLPAARSLGLMSHLISNAIDKAACEEIDFLFLIPASETLRKWYAHMGFHDSAPRCYMLSGGVPTTFQPCSDTALMAHSLRQLEQKQPSGTLIHSDTDLISVTEEWLESGNEFRVTSSGNYVFLSNNTIVAADDYTLNNLLPGSGIKTFLFPSQQNSVHAKLYHQPYGMYKPLHKDLPPLGSISFMMD